MASMLFTVGHSTRSVEELVRLLTDSGVDLLVDVRSFPRSRANPQFNAEVLPAALAAAGINYRHLEALGGRRGPQGRDTPSPNTHWRRAGFRNYADYAMTSRFRLGLDTLRDLARSHSCAIMCAEAMWWRCHRQIIADYLLAAGHDVVHILGPGKSEPARLTPGAEPQADGTVHYPGAQDSLL
ncbi:MAG: DUF488 family protein [Kiloniellales bacterium]